VLDAGGCIAGQGGGNQKSVAILDAGDVTPFDGGCIPDGGGIVDGAAPTPLVPARACFANTGGHPRGGCGAGFVCAPPVGASEKRCITTAGDAGCPDAGAYSVRYQYFAGVLDARGCGACVCEGPTGGTCGTVG